MESLLDELLLDDYVIVCYGPTLQWWSGTSVNNREQIFNIAALRGSKIDETNYEKIVDSSEYTPLLSYTGSVGWIDIIADADFQISNFEPHCSTCNDCDIDIACPDCGDE